MSNNLHRVRTLAVVALAGLVAVLAPACRARGLWSGAEHTSDGMLQVAAEEPVCGCLTLTNLTEETIYLRSTLRGSTLGAAVLNATEVRRFRFDWAGTGTEDFYIIEAIDENGRVRNMRRVVSMEVRQIECDAATCVFDTLLLNVAHDAQ